MAEYLSPGVYVEEIDAGPKPIEGVSTSTAGAVGVTSFGPTSGKPVLVTSFAEFVRTFGGFLPQQPANIVNSWSDPEEGGAWWQFPLAVKGFFDNGGQRLYVKRVFSGDAAASEGSLGKGLVSPVKRDEKKDAKELQLAHLIGISANTSITVYNGELKKEIGTFKVELYDAATGTVTLDKALAEPVRVKRGDFASTGKLSADPVPPAEKTLIFSAKSKGGWSDKALSVRVGASAGASLSLLPTPAAGQSLNTSLTEKAVAAATTIKVGSVKGLANGDKVQIGGATYTVSNVTADPTTKLSQVASAGKTTLEVAALGAIKAGDTVEIEGKEYKVSSVNAGANSFDVGPPGAQGVLPAGAEVRLLPRSFDIAPAVPAGDWEIGTKVQRLRPASGATATIAVSGASRLYEGALVELDNGAEKETFVVQKVEGDALTLDRTPTKDFIAGHLLRVIEAEVAVRLSSQGQAPVEERFGPLRLKDDGSLNYLVNHVNTRSSLVKVRTEAAFQETDIASFPCAPSGSWCVLSGGDDRLDSLTVEDFVGKDGGSGNRTGIQALEDIEEVSMCLVPGMWSNTVQGSLIQHCEALRYRFAILDPREGDDIEHIQSFRESLTDTKFAALYYPWVKVRDPSLHREVALAPSGHIAGIYARVDVDRGVHKAPANEVIIGIKEIARDVNKREQDILNPRGINALRFFPGRGHRVWGARTISSDASWKYVNVKRLFIFVEKSIDEGTQWVVFEPNSEPLWARVRQSVTNFLTTVWRSGALEGTKPEEAFFVKCDRTTMTQDDIDNGRLICLVGIAPVKPAEFVIFRIQQYTFESQAS